MKQICAFSLNSFSLLTITAIIFLSLLSNVQAESKKPKLIIPDAYWETIFFESINELSNGIDLPNLREIVLPNDDKEIRIWVGFGLANLEGLILSKTSNQWTAHHAYIRGKPHQDSFEIVYHKDLVTPKRGWAYLQNRLQEYGIETLPDASELPGELPIRDGQGYVVEINHNGVYRTYQYGNPYFQPWEEAVQMLKIANLFKVEFGLPWAVTSWALPGRIKDGQVVLLKKGQAYGAFICENQGNYPEKGDYFWIYREDGKGELYGSGLKSGNGKLDEYVEFPIDFGPFKLKWSAGGALYWPNQKRNEGEEDNQLYIAITEETDVGNINAADSKWPYKARHIEFQD